MSAPASRRRTALAALACAAFTACGGGSGGGNNPPPPAISITSTTLTAGVVGQPYSQTLTVTGGTGARTFAISAGLLPPGLSLGAATGVISGTPSGSPGASNFTVRVEDSASPPQSDAQALSIEILAPPAQRNDTIADATPAGNGTFSASISPAGDPTIIFDPDEDYYSVTATAASIVTVNIDAQVNGSPIDTVIEIVDATGAVLNQCVAPAYSSPCVSDDEDLGVDLDSFLELQVTGPTTFYIHVVDWGSNARPDMLYDLIISGVT